MVQSLKHVLHLKSTLILHKENTNKDLASKIAYVATVQLMPSGIFHITLAGSGFPAPEVA